MALDNLLRDKLERWRVTFESSEAGIVAEVLVALCQLDDAVHELSRRLDILNSRSQR